MSSVYPAFSAFNDNVHYIILITLTIVAVITRDYDDAVIAAKMFIIAATNLSLKKVLGIIIPKLTNSDLILTCLVYRPDTVKSGLPSGHCMIVFSTIPLLPLAILPYGADLLVLYGAFIAYDRVKKNQHTPLQVIIGAAVGAMMGFMMF